ncbi:GNAT family N-acetyltransferase [Propioniciclava sp.]|uniref:GNAT family N-acetyltransferase n=1 Tax=Propioniciclava sp. TaxID=2038686 RepID=UPI002627CFE4|nr:GNAT family N-acetyltransferase [Propioniciclava sp.]
MSHRRSWPVHLRPLLTGDAELLADWGADPVFCAHAGWNADASWRERVAWARRDLPDDLLRRAALVGADVVGYVDLHGAGERRELGYVVGGRDRWGQGLGHAVAFAGLEWGFGSLGLAEIWAEAIDANVPSVRILERLGMRETGRGGDATFLGRNSFYRVFTLTATEFAP